MDLSRNDPVDFYHAIDFVPPALVKTGIEILTNWWYIHDLKQYYLIAKSLYDVAK